MGLPEPDVSAAVLAGGLGTRLRPVVADRPKVLAPVGCRPFLGFLLEQLARAGLREAVLLTGYRADQVHDAFGDRFGGMRLRYSVEPSPLGTAGAVRHALPLLKARDVLLLNGDSFADFDLPLFLAFHRARAAGASLVLARVADASRYGRAHAAPDGRLLRFEEKAAGAAPGWVNAGVYLIRRGLLEGAPPGRPASLERDLLPAWARAGAVYGLAGGDRFLDIGAPDSYAAAEAFFRDRRAV
jgi:NDP-sugar pyrophosphorylase family protein